MRCVPITCFVRHGFSLAESESALSDICVVFVLSHAPPVHLHIRGAVRILLVCCRTYSADDVPDVFFAGGKSIRFTRPSRIIMGLQISDSHRTEIEKMATLAGIPLVQARQTEYGLDISGATEYTSQRIGSYV